MSRKHARIALAATSTLVGLLICYLAWKGRPVSASARLVDSRQQLDAIIEQHLSGVFLGEGSRPASSSPLTGLIERLPPLKRRKLTRQEAESLFASIRTGAMEYDPHTYYWCRPNLRYRRRMSEHPDGSWAIRTNDQGFRKSVDVMKENPDLRILFAGDSHTGGVVPEDENMVQVLEALLRQANPDQSIEALNGGHGGFGFYQYLGTLERNAHLAPDVFVVVGFGGNDFRDAVRLYRLHNSLRRCKVERPLPRQWGKRIQDIRRDILAQDLMQLLEFAEASQRVGIAELAVCQVMREIKRQCDEAGTRLIYVHIPPSMDVQPHILGEFREPILEVCPLTEEELARTDRLTDRILHFLGGLGVETLDMRPAYRASADDCYWKQDYHINPRGHRLIAEALALRLGDA